MKEPKTKPQRKKPAKAKPTFFKISSGLKRIIGRDLIVNDFVAVFELVKNSFDAGAKKVDLTFLDDALVIADNGKGMSRADINDKWLFVAYSAKRDGTEDKAENYRDRIKTPKVYAGSKGVGRFSCDRLGQSLLLQTRTSKKDAKVEVIDVDWGRFEQDDTEEFSAVPISYSETDSFTLPNGIKEINRGTVLEIRGLRQPWDREKLLLLKAALSKLINPFGQKADRFDVTVQAPSELEKDLEITGGVSPLEAAPLPAGSYHRVVNGKIHNFIFDTLREKTTFIEAKLSKNGRYIDSRLIDRGEQIYHIREKNDYTLLYNSGVEGQLFYLNQSAKQTFARRMGVNSVSFGSVFLFRNGFRVFPIGEEGDDSFELDRRKTQGFGRHLGTREVIGRVDVTGSEEDFKEASSRDQGLIRTPAYVQLESFIKEKCIKRLERYVTDISWKDPPDSTYEDISRMLGDKSSSRIIELIARMADSPGIELIEYSPNIVRIIDQKSEDFLTALNAIKVVAERTGNKALSKEIKAAEVRYLELQRAESEAREEAEKERAAREQAESRAETAAKAQQKAEAAYEEEKKRSLFLTAEGSRDPRILVNLHHQIVIYASEIHNNIATQLDKLRHGEAIDPKDLEDIFARLEFKTQQILAVSKFATKANFRLDAGQIKADIAAFILEYLQEVSIFYAADKLELEVISHAKKLERQFKPIEMSMVLDNLISNSSKADASKITFDISQPRANELRIVVTDDGNGIDPSLAEPKRIFERGVTTTKGSGLGLHHTKFILDQMRGDIELDETYKFGARFIMRIFK